MFLLVCICRSSNMNIPVSALYNCNHSTMLWFVWESKCCPFPLLINLQGYRQPQVAYLWPQEVWLGHQSWFLSLFPVSFLIVSLYCFQTESVVTEIASLQKFPHALKCSLWLGGHLNRSFGMHFGVAGEIQYCLFVFGTKQESFEADLLNYTKP